ncbi:hypothetical protein [Corynebacterium sp. 11A]|uniref:hypothetical protein n=1 Tax=Corynebacterium sp. 11A TaxID=2080510 RepID=UPI00178C1E19|nr:hypothetical protein [Corynebacterium sp. 11A]
MRSLTKGISACVIAVSTLCAGVGTANAVQDRPWWDPTQVIESPVNPNRAEGAVEGVSFTASDSAAKEVSPSDWARVTFTGTGFTPGLYYTVRVTLREPGTGRDWGVYTWLTYRATAEGKIHSNLRVFIPSRAVPGEKVIAVPTVYNAEDVRRDGRPEKADPSCVLQCERVAPLAAYTNLTDPGATITIR